MSETLICWALLTVGACLLCEVILLATFNAKYFGFGPAIFRMESKLGPECLPEVVTRLSTAASDEVIWRVKEGKVLLRLRTRPRELLFRLITSFERAVISSKRGKLALVARTPITLWWALLVFAVLFVAELILENDCPGLMLVVGMLAVPSCFMVLVELHIRDRWREVAALVFTT